MAKIINNYMSVLCADLCHCKAACKAPASSGIIMLQLFIFCLQNVLMSGFSEPKKGPCICSNRDTSTDKKATASCYFNEAYALSSYT